MLFNSYAFIFCFLPLAVVVYFFLARKFSSRHAMAWMVLSSLFFYGWWDWHYVPLLLVSIGFNYLMGKRIAVASRRKAWLVTGICGNLLLLGYYKYTAFFMDTMNGIVGESLWAVPEIVLPLGISFFTFTQTAYLVDVYRREADSTSLLAYAEFVTVFPHLIAGPIIHHKDMIPQFKDERNYLPDWRNIALGLTIFTIGLFKKQAVADKLSPWVGEAFAHAGELSCLEAWLAALGYTFQLYFDFSGYSEMAIGLGLLFNLKFPMNFNAPYKAGSIIDFWRRWHMTLGFWVKNYLYIPLGGNRRGFWRKHFNLFICMLIIGVWHGAGWTFIFWGALHGAYLVSNHLWRHSGYQLPQCLNWGLTFLSVVIAWVFFRAESFPAAFALLSAMAGLSGIMLPAGGWLEKHLADCGYVSFSQWLVPTDSIAMVLVVGVLLWRLDNPLHYVEHFRSTWKWLALAAAMALYALYELNSYTEFLYFQF